MSSSTLRRALGRCQLAAALAALAGCAGGAAEPLAQSSGESEVLATHEVAPIASASAREEPNRPTFAASARLQPEAPAPSASASAPPPAKRAMEGCEPNSPPPGYEDCHPIEVVGGPPCELECWRKRATPKTADRCCEHPVHGAIFGKSGLLVEADACQYVDPNCAHSAVKSIESGFHFYSDSNPREVLLVQGGCEMRAMGHGYVPAGVAAWTGCPVVKRFRWNGTRFTLVP